MNFKQKLLSRKWWAALIGVVVSLLVLFDVDSVTVERITSLITAVSSMIIYTLTEGIIDAKAVNLVEETTIDLSEEDE